MRVPWTARRSNQCILKEISPEYSLEGLMLKLQYFGNLMRTANSLENTQVLGKTIALTIQTFVSKEMSLLFNTLFRFVIAFLPRNNHLLISWLQSPTAVILEPKKIKSVTVSTVFPPICHEVMGPNAMIFVF